MILAVVFTLFVVATVACILQVNWMFKAMDAGTRVRRLRSQRMIRTAGLWQLTIAAVMVSAPGDGWPNAVSVGLCGLFMIGAAHFWKRTGLPY